jgi:NAD-dependent SIR2 family protein deacetylase
MINCPECGGELQVLGVLGNLQHLRCRHCGLQFSRDKDKERKDQLWCPLCNSELGPDCEFDGPDLICQPCAEDRYNDNCCGQC